MEEERLEKQLSDLFQAKCVTEKKILEIEREFAKLLCPKGKKECEPAYCTYRFTDTCPFLQKWRKLCGEYNISFSPKM